MPRRTGRARAPLTPTSVPGHTERQDLTGAVVAGDAPLYGGLDTIKRADVLLAEAEQHGQPACPPGVVP
jgi:arginine decarboxylase